MAESKVCARGFDIFADGATHTFSPGDKVPGYIVEQVKNPKVWLPRGVTQEEMDELSRAQEEENFEEDDGLDDMTVAELKEFAETSDVDLGHATRRADILKAIRDHVSAD